MQRALVREIPNTFDRAITGKQGRVPDVELARLQHSLYRAALEGNGYAVDVLGGDDRFPDCVFVEDTAVVIGDVVVATNPGAESRVGEVAAVSTFFSDRLQLASIEAPGTLDGGDVMTLGETIYIGRSGRTNREGAEQLAGIAKDQGLTSIFVPVDGVLHLKSAVLPLDPKTVVVTPGTVDENLLSELRIVYEHPSERFRFSALPLTSGTSLVTSSAPKTNTLLRNEGYDLTPIDVSEILAADGGLTCMSIMY